ncbi:MAG TPA: Sec-dependent nitrous-oxide reductase [Cyclobacteriaceae bacterium]|nr:Sec-dependent nitrous-oxide reductase [Cyclobacteriaceae bacterium]HMV10564.1 Sec-dependent nitrous-oxide reductase [Cyclobacteriaceae bacterium]HMV88536.1 Sec-dependent nitrous-oxide reductase [Cyclobacteriaceae bacterium]HMW99424.1 Sec-dependent nitrous-oxide reductase [Cyclobacteriaceae bacterium]HMX48787.1 Sec-dependent nitrous-oxide reductase [Cyclobacteriaceae bacterium]
MKTVHKILWGIAGIITAFSIYSCKPSGPKEAITGDAASRAYVAPGKYDEFYNIVSGGFNGQIGVYGLPSGRLLKIIPVFSTFTENGYGYSEESKPMLNTANGFVPWDDLHHISLSTTNGEHDGRWAFANGNNTPRVARVDLKTFKTVEILEIPNSGGNHSSPYITENTEYVVASTRFSVPIGNNLDVPISSFKENFKGTVSFIKVDTSGHMNIAFQLITPGVSFDLARAGKGPSHGWFFFSTYNTEQAYTLLEVNASQKDKDFIMAVNWKKAEEYIKAGKGKSVKTKYAHNTLDESTHLSSSKILEEVLQLDPAELKDILYFIPCPKSPHGCDVDPSGEYIVASGKLAATIPVFSFTKLMDAISKKDFEGDFAGIPVVKYESALYGEVPKPGLGPLHTEFDEKGNAYTSMFVSSEIVKWNVKDLKVLDRVPTYYSIGHLSVPGGPTRKPHGKYVVAYNKITKDRYLPTGPELTQSAQLYDISGDKMKLILDFPTNGEPHYAESIPAEMLMPKSQKIYKLEDNKHPYAALGEGKTKVERKGNEVHVYMTAIRSHLTPDNIEGIKQGDDVYFHVTNLEQDWDVPHGFAIKGANNAEILIMPGETQTLKWKADRIGVFPFYCTDFCSALHQEMQGYARVSAPGSNVPTKYSTGKIEDQTTGADQ